MNTVFSNLYEEISKYPTNTKHSFIRIHNSRQNTITSKQMEMWSHAAVLTTSENTVV